ncbi:MAG: mechanosensitive ion channel family protein [Phycisphaeraceae bacterium JB051]
MNARLLAQTQITVDWDKIRTIWDYKLFPVEGNNYVTVGQLSIALLILAAGMIVIRFITGLVASALKRTSRVNPQAAIILQRIVFYALLSLLVISCMQFVGIPITTLTVVGGALAIGIGFGTQNIVNNFISGLILLIEQPIRVNDMIEVDDHLGKIAAVNSRCTRLRRVDGIDVLIPNSKLLENSVVNWTLTDDIVRGDVEVGIAYGSDTELARKILLEISEAEDRIIKTDTMHPVKVFFNSFGDNSLVFNLYFWMHASNVGQIRELCSDLRFEIDKRYREADICIAFPQRDVHLDTLKPLEIKMIQDNSQQN